MMKGRRLSFLIPGLWVTLAIVNPWLYRKWDSLGLYAYWRILWIVPVIPVIAGIIPAITEPIQAGGEASEADTSRSSFASRKVFILKALITIVGVGLVAITGTFLYNGVGGSFVEAANASKEPDFAVELADTLLELDESPRVVFQHPIGTYVRQYTGEIDQLYGRNIDGYILGANGEARTVNNALNDPESDLNTVATLMANNDYEYLVADGTDRETALDEAGFKLIDTVSGYGIYEAHGVPTQIKERNELGLVVSTTTVDEDGTPINGDSGYAKVAWEYDQNGLVIREFRTDVEGIGVANSNGSAGFERNYDDNARILMERYIDPDGVPIANNIGYAAFRRDYRGADLIAESYYAPDGQPVDRIDTRYATIRMTYDDR